MTRVTRGALLVAGVFILGCDRSEPVAPPPSRPMLSTQGTAAPGFAVTDFATGFDNSFDLGPIGLAFDASGNLFVSSTATNTLYKFGPGGGVASTATQIGATNSLGCCFNDALGLTFVKDGSLFLSRLASRDIVQLDPSAGTIIRTIASGLPGPTGLATDPLSGDLFVSTGAIVRISNFAQGPGTVTSYASVGSDGIAFGADGTLFASLGNAVAVVAGTNSATPGAVTIISAPFSGGDGIAVSATAGAPFLYVNRNDGVITKIDRSTDPPTFTDIFSGGSRGDFVNVGPDGCLYATQTDRVIKVTNADGTCLPPPLGPLTPTNPPPKCAPQPSGIVSWWPAEGSANDIADGNNGTLQGGAAFAAGEVGQAFLLDGVNADVDAGNAPNLHVSDGDFTVEGWVRFNGLAGDMSIVDKMSDGLNNIDGWRLLKQADNRFWFCFGSTSNQCFNPAFTVFSQTVAQTGVWYHVAAVKSAAGFAIYVNGVQEDARAPLPSFLDTHAADLRIGANAVYAHLNGEIDEASIYNRALSAAEIQSIFAAGSAGKCRPSLQLPPIANAGGPYAANEGGTVAFNGAGSSDPGGLALTYSWDFGDGSPAATGTTPTHTYADEGTFTVTLTVTNSGSLSNAASTTTTIANISPSVSPIGGATLHTGQTFTGSGSFTDPGLDTWTATVDYGDGSGTQALALSGKTFQLSHVYGVTGTYSVTVTVTDDDGATGVGQGTVIVQSSSAQQALQALINTIRNLVTRGALAAGNGNALIVKLQAAITALNLGNNTDATDALQAFINQLNALTRVGRLPAVQGQSLLDAVNAIIRAIDTP